LAEAEQASFNRKIDLEIADKARLKRMKVWGRIGDSPLDRIGADSLQCGKFEHQKKRFQSLGMHASRPTVWTDIFFNLSEAGEILPMPEKGK
jgi:hypothetical protein